jgi:hypothetical protein
LPDVKKSGFERVRRLGAALPGTEESTFYGTPALKLRGKMFACMASHRSADPNTLVVQIPTDQRDDFIAADPGIYYLTEHYVAYPTVLVRLSRIGDDALRDLLLMARRFVDGRAKARRPRPRSRVRRPGA